jgi:hypothetical protein
MKKTIIFALLFCSLISCEKTNLERRCISVTFSDALPIQFWPEECQTYNEYEAEGVHHVCFCLPFNCDDNVYLQIGDVAPTDNQNQLIIFDSDSQWLDTITFLRGNGYDYLTLNLNDYCDQQIQLTVGSASSDLRTTDQSDFPNRQNFSDIWAETGSGAPWNIQPTQMLLTLSNLLGTLSKDNVANVGGGGRTRLRVRFAQAFDFEQVQVKIRFYDSAALVNRYVWTKTVQVNEQDSPVTTNYEYDETFDIDGSYDQVILTFQVFNLSGGNTTIAVQEVLIDTFVIVRKSDCISVKENHKETVLITYSNNRDYAGLVYPEITPPAEFNIRIPAVFFEQRFPQESETEELSNSRSVQLFAQIRKQRLLSTGQMPFYLHDKIILILQHQFVTINDIEYIKREGYELQESNKRWPLRRALCWLDQKDYIIRNVL